MNKDIVKLSDAHREVVPTGEAAITVLTLYRPEKGYEGPWRAPAYSMFSNANQTALFITQEDASQPIWNESLQRYEVEVRAESLAIGCDYNLPVGSITYVVSTDLVGFTHVVNLEPSVGGQGPQKEVL